MTLESKFSLCFLLNLSIPDLQYKFGLLDFSYTIDAGAIEKYSNRGNYEHHVISSDYNLRSFIEWERETMFKNANKAW